MMCEYLTIPCNKCILRSACSEERIKHILSQDITSEELAELDALINVKSKEIELQKNESNEAQIGINHMIQNCCITK